MSANAPTFAATLAELCAERGAWRERGVRVAFTNGCFDLLHAGHLSLLEQARAAADVLVVVAGMEGALPSLVAGMVAAPVVAVPTSVGYGAAFDGLAALLAMLNSCAVGVSVVNIDNGFGAGALAARILARRAGP